MGTRWAMGALLFAVGMLIGASEAAAQACPLPNSVPEGVYDVFVDQLDELPLLNPERCSQLTRGGVATCHKAVKSATSCYQSLYRSTFKAQKIACGATIDPAECTAIYKSLLEETLDQIDAVSDSMHAECDGVFAEALYDACLAV